MGIKARIAIGLLAAVMALWGQAANQLRFALRTDPKTFDPLLETEEASQTIRFLTGGVLLRFNRETQRVEPELASSWKISSDGRRIDFVLRRGVHFSDGSPFGPTDVVATFRRLMDPKLPSGIADEFRGGGGEIRAEATGPNEVSVFLSAPVAGEELLFDQLAISSVHAAPDARVVLGPFMLADYKTGQYVLLRRNPNYWKSDASGRRLPYLDSIRLDIQTNRETELLRFRRGELHFVDRVEPEAFERLKRESPAEAVNAGSSLDAEFMWFNQNPNAPLSAPEKRWFQSKLFRKAVSAAIDRDGIVELVYRGFAQVAVGPVSPSNRLWFNRRLAQPKLNPELALQLLEDDGFRFDGTRLRDREGNRVEFSLITNADDRMRAQIGAIIQQDLKRIGIQVSFTAIEFRSLIERITKTQQYESCLLGFSNVEIDPNSQMNIWTSSANLHAWNPGEKSPATPWEEEIDRFMKLQATVMDQDQRKKAFDRVQEIAAEQAPIIYLVHPDVLAAVSPLVRNLFVSPLPPHLYWNLESVSVRASPEARER
jgi:peptide/nickel transport system substrate-binding protein